MECFISKKISNTHRIFFFFFFFETIQERKDKTLNEKKKTENIIKQSRWANLNLLIEENCFDKFCYNYKKEVAVEVLQYRYDKFTILFGTISTNGFVTNRHVTIDHFDKIIS